MELSDLRVRDAPVQASNGHGSVLAIGARGRSVGASVRRGMAWRSCWGSGLLPRGRHGHRRRREAPRGRQAGTPKRARASR